MDVSILMEHISFILCTVVITTITAIYVFKHFFIYGYNRQPFLYPFFGCLFQMLQNKDRFLDWATDNLRKSPNNTVKLFRPGETAYAHTAYPPNVEHILKNKFEVYAKGEYFKDGLADLLGGGIFNVDDGLWKIQRKIASYEFTTRSLRDYLMETLEQETQERLLPTLHSLSGTVVDLQDIFMRFAFDNICKLAFGLDMAALDTSLPEIKFMKVFDEATSLSNARFYTIHPVIWKVKKIFNIGSERQLHEAIQAVHEFAESIIEARRAQVATENHHFDLLSRFMQVKDVSEEDLWGIEQFYSCKIQNGQFPSVFFRDIVVSFLLAGRDTSSAALAWFFWLVLTHPDATEKIVSEINDITSGGKEKITFDKLKDMHYLHCALMESLRLYPPVSMDPKEARKDDVLPDGTRVRKGEKVTYFAYAMGRMECLWGSDCLEFRPERWLKDGQFVNENVYKFPVFHAGPRMCLGKDMAILQMKYVVASLLPRFSFVLPEGYVPRQKVSLTLQIDGGLPAVVRSK